MSPPKARDHHEAALLRAVNRAFERMPSRQRLADQVAKPGTVAKPPFPWAHVLGILGGLALVAWSLWGMRHPPGS